jgi:ketosteroid isomerase-like protein
VDDVEAIKQLKARYFRCMDTKDFDTMREVFTDDCVIDTESSGGGIQEGKDNFFSMLLPSLEGVTTVHHGHMPEITLTSATTAEGVWAMEDKLWWPEGSPLKHLHGYGHYHETYEKGADGAWRIKTLKLTRLRTDVEFA